MGLFVMDPALLKIFGATAGLGGLAVGAVVIVFSNIIRKNIFPRLPARESYRLLRLIVVSTFSIATVGIVAWAFVEVRGTGTAPQTKTAITSGAGSSIISNVVGNVTTNSGKSD
jgi:hypothetical protein